MGTRILFAFLTRVFQTSNIHSFYRNLLCILKNFRENRKILAQNREVGQGFLRQCLRGIPVSILRSPHPRVLLLKNSLPPSYGSITWKLFVFFIEALHLNIKDTILLRTMRSRVCVYFSAQGIYPYSSPEYANKMILRYCNWNPIESTNRKKTEENSNRVCTFRYIMRACFISHYQLQYFGITWDFIILQRYCSRNFHYVSKRDKKEKRT